MRLPKSLYESLPLVLAMSGAALLLRSPSIGNRPLQFSMLIAGAVLVVASVVLFLKRRDYRLSRSRVKYDKLDDWR